jgi:NADH dehydrogenase
MTSLPARIAVLGGTGFVGRAACEHLVRAGGGGASTTLLVPTRRAMHGNTLRLLPGVEVREADVHDDGALARLLAGCDALVNLIAILHGSARDFEQVHAVLPQRLARACQAVGIKRVVHVSALGVASDAPSNYLRSKAAGEAVLKAAPLDLTILRPSVIFGANDRFLNLFAELQAVFPVMPLAGRDARFQPVWVDDVAEAIVRCLQRPETIGRTIECAGPEVWTLGELVRAAGRWSGHERPIVPLPMAAGRLQALAMELLPGTPLMSRDNLDSMRVPNVAGGGLPGLESLGIAPAALAGVAPAWLGHHDGCTRLNAMRARARRANG